MQAPKTEGPESLRELLQAPFSSPVSPCRRAKRHEGPCREWWRQLSGQSSHGIQLQHLSNMCMRTGSCAGSGSHACSCRLHRTLASSAPAGFVATSTCSRQERASQAAFWSRLGCRVYSAQSSPAASEQINRSRPPLLCNTRRRNRKHLLQLSLPKTHAGHKKHTS